MIPETFYFATYVCVLNGRIYDEFYFKMINLLRKECFFKETADELLKILGDDENKISLDEVLENLRIASDEEKDKAITLGLDAALADDSYTDKEEQLFLKECDKINYPINKFKKIFNKVKLAADQEVVKNVKKIKKTHRKFFLRKKEKASFESLEEQLTKRYINCLLSGVDYDNSIKQMYQIANEDIIYAKEALNNISKEMNDFLSSLIKSERKVTSMENRLRKKDYDENISKCLEEIKKQITNFITQTKEQVWVSLRRKEIAAKYYTISFLGRTKAGKSTLHSVILGGLNREFIGTGKERTTRINRIYKWNGIRIIDTPGIGAPGGKTDVEIARSIVDESDLICYVVTTDSIQETEFAFLKELKSQNKPIIILLNKKENLNHPIHKKKFLDNPLYWFNRTDGDSLEGHFTRIREYAEKYYNNAYFEIFPVQLMAAQLALTEENKAIREKFEKGSRFKFFKDNLKIQILENGKIKRSQTILNGTIYSVGKYKNEFDSQIKELEAIKATVNKQSCSAISKIKKTGQNIASSLRTGFESIYDNFIQSDIRFFANEYYNLKRDALKTKWKQFFKHSGFENRLKDRLEKEIDAYKNEIESIIQEFSENLNFSFDTLDVKFDLRGTFDTKTFVTITGDLTALAGGILLIALGASNPIGWVVLGIGTVTALVSSLFKSKAKKIKEAQDKLYESIKNTFKENRTASINKCINAFEELASQTETSIENMFNAILNELEKLIDELKPLKVICLQHETKLNKLYGIRIINFANSEDVFDLTDKNVLSHIEVDHDFAKHIHIKTDLIKQLDTKKLKHILQEDIYLEAL